MATNQLSHAEDIVRFEVRIESSLLSKLDENMLCTELRQGFGELLESLGIPGQPYVDIRTEAFTPGSQQFLSISVDGQDAFLPLSVMRHICGYVSGEIVNELWSPTGISKGLERFPDVQIAAVIRSACIEMIRRAPAILFTTNMATEYRSTLATDGDKVSWPDATWLQSVLSPVLNMRISIAEQTKIAQVIKDGLVSEQQPRDISEELIGILRPQTIEIQLTQETLEEFTLHFAESDGNRFVELRDGLFYELGVRYPTFSFVPVEDLCNHEFRFRINDLTTVPTRGLRPDQRLVNETPDRLGLLNLDGQAALNPSNKSLCAIIRDVDTDLARAAGLPIWDPLEYLILAFSAELRTSAQFFIDQIVIEEQLSRTHWNAPMLVEATKAKIPRQVLTQVVRHLLSEQISVLNLPQILESMINLDYDGPPYALFIPEQNSYHRPVPEWFTDPINLATLVRIRMNRYICHKFQQRDNTLVAHLLDPKIEALLVNNVPVPPDEYLAQMDSETTEQILRALRQEFEALPPTELKPMILVNTAARAVLRQIAAPEFPEVVVLSYSELASDAAVQPLARIS